KRDPWFDVIQEESFLNPALCSFEKRCFQHDIFLLLLQTTIRPTDAHSLRLYPLVLIYPLVTKTLEFF
ncbi:MAG: hypothetical protein ACRENG_23270, partial [bacterium]